MRPHPKARGCPPHSGGEARLLGFHREAVALAQSHATQAEFAPLWSFAGAREDAQEARGHDAADGPRGAAEGAGAEQEAARRRGGAPPRATPRPRHPSRTTVLTPPSSRGAPRASTPPSLPLCTHAPRAHTPPPLQICNPSFHIHRSTRSSCATRRRRSTSRWTGPTATVKPAVLASPHSLVTGELWWWPGRVRSHREAAASVSREAHQTKLTPFAASCPSCSLDELERRVAREVALEEAAANGDGPGGHGNVRRTLWSALLRLQIGSVCFSALLCLGRSCHSHSRQDLSAALLCPASVASDLSQELQRPLTRANAVTRPPCGLGRVCRSRVC